MTATFSADQVVIGSGIAAVGVYLACTLLMMAATDELPAIMRLLRTQLPADQDAPDFDAKNSNSVDLTLVTTALGAILSANLLPAPSATHPDLHTAYLPDTDTYTYLSIFFAALLALALLVYWASRYALCYLAADSLILWGATGSVITVVLAITELDGFSKVNRTLFVVALLVGFLLVAYARINATRVEMQRLRGAITTRRAAAATAAAAGGQKGIEPRAIPAMPSVEWQIK